MFRELFEKWLQHSGFLVPNQLINGQTGGFFPVKIPVSRKSATVPLARGRDRRPLWRVHRLASGYW